MNKQRALIVAMVLAALIAAALLFVPGLKGSAAARVLYLPAVLLALVFSGGDHSPSATAWNSAFATYSITYLFLVVALYALLLQLYLLFSVTRSMGWPEPVEPMVAGRPPETLGFATTGSEEAFSGTSRQAQALATQLGRSLQAYERRRRSHWLLAPRHDIDLDAAPADAAGKAVETQTAPRAVGWMVRRLEAQGKAVVGAEVARRTVARAFDKRR